MRYNLDDIGCRIYLQGIRYPSRNLLSNQLNRVNDILMIFGELVSNFLRIIVVI